MANQPEPLDVLLALLRSASVEDRREAAEGLTWHPQVRDAIPHLVRALEDPDERVSGTAGFALDEHHEYFRDAAPTLLELLRHPEAVVRIRTLSRLKRAPLDEDSGDVLVAMLEMLTDPDPEVHHLAGYVLLKFPPAARQKLLAPQAQSVQDCAVALRSGDRLNRMRAALALGEHGTSAPALLADILTQEGDAGVRRAAAEALSWVEPLPMALALAAAEHPDAHVRLFAVKALGDAKTGPLSVFRRALTDEDPWVRHAAAEALRQKGSDAAATVPDLVEALHDPDDWVRGEVVRVLWKLGSQARAAVPALIEKLGDRRASTRSAAASLLAGDLAEHSREALLPLLALLDDPDAEVRRTAAASLVEICLHVQDAETVGQVVATVLRHGDQAVRYFAVGALSDIVRKAKAGDVVRNAEFATTALIGALRDPSAKVRHLAAEALCYGPRPKDAIPALMECRHDSDVEVRRAAARAFDLYGVDAAPALPALLEALEDADPQARFSAGRAILSMKPPQPGLIPTYVGLLRAPEFPLRQMAAEALGLLGSSAAEALPALDQLLANEEELEEVRAAAVEAAHHIRK